MPEFLQQIPLLTILGAGPITSDSFIQANIFFWDVKKVIIGGSINETTSSAFQSFHNLETVSITSDSFIKMGQQTFVSLFKLTTVDFGNTIQTIDTLAFDGCVSLQPVTLPKSLVTIGYRAFYSCQKLTSVTFEANSLLTKLDDDAFFSSQLTGTLAIPHSLKTLGYRVFGHTQVSKITFGPNLNSIQYGSLQIMAALKIVEIDPSNPIFYSSNNCIYSRLTNELLQFPNGFSGVFVIPDFATKLHQHAFGYSFELAEVTFGEKVEEVGDYCFADCNKLAKITFPTNSVVRSIGIGCFSKNALTTFYIPLTLTSIGSGAFAGCTKLSTVKIETGHQSFAYYQQVLYGDAYKSLLFCPATVENLILHPNLLKIPDSCFYQNTNIKTIQFSQNIDYIGVSAFFQCSQLTELSFPKSLKSIDGSAFGQCNNLNKISFPDGNDLQAVEWSAFLDCYNLVTINFGNNPISSSLRFSIFAFAGIGISTLVLPRNLYRLQSNCFENCKHLREITFDYETIALEINIFSSCNNLKNIYLNIPVINPNSFSKVDGLEVLTLRSRTKEIQDYAFSSCSKLKSIVFESVTDLKIKTLAFSFCLSLGPSITLPPLMNDIYPDSFSYCNSLLKIFTSTEEKFKSEDGILYSKDLKSLVLCPSGIASVQTIESAEVIGIKSFYGCTLLHTVSFGTQISTISDYCFFGCSALREVNIPISVKIFGNSPFMECKNLETIYYCSKTCNIILLSPNPIEEHVQIVVRFDYVADQFLDHPVVKSTAIKKDQCPLKPSELFSVKKRRNVRETTRFNAFLLMFLLN